MPPVIRRRPLTADESALAAKYVSLVRGVARRVARRLPRHMDLDDLASSGFVGLIDAAQRFDAKRGVPFPDYAELRIRGAILDDLRKRDSLSRDMRDNAGQIRSAEDAFAADHGRKPEDHELAEQMNIPLERLRRMRQDLSGWLVVGIDDAGPALLDHRPDERAADPLDRVMRMEMLALAEVAASTLPDHLRAAMALYYTEDMNLKEVGEVMGYTESRACQVMQEARARMRHALRKVALET